MATHKTIDRLKTGQKKSASVPAKRNQTTAASVQAGREHRVIDRRQTGQKQTVTLPTVPAQGQNTGGGGYYSPREYGAQTGAYEARVTAARTAMEEQGKNLQTSRTEVENLWKAAQDAQTAYQNCRGMFKGASAAQYEQQFLTRWTDAAKSYSERYQQFEQEYEKYKPYEDAYNAALGEYNAYVTAEREAYGQWKSTIRGAEDIRAEQKKVKEARQSLVAYMGLANQYAEDPFTAPDVIAANEARIKELQAYLGGVGEREKLLAEELDWSEHFRFEDLRQNGDFGEKSRFTGVDNQGDRVYQYVNGNPNAVSGSIDALLDSGTQDDLLLQMMGGNDGWRDIIGYNETPTYLEHMTEDEKAMYNYVYSTQGRDAAQGYLDHLKPELTDRKTGAVTKFWRMLAGQNGLTGALYSGLSVPMNAAGGIQAGLGQVASALRGEELDHNASYNLMANTKNAIRDEVSGKIQEHAGPVGSFAYGTVMSMADMAMDAAAGNPAAATALIGTRAFSEQVIDSKDRGLSDEQALSMGITSAFAELVTEKLGLDELLHLPDKWATAGFWKGAARGAGGEALEEGLTNLMNLAADISIAGDKSEFAQSVELYKAEGLTEEKAVWKALGDAGISLALDAAGGAISGGVYGGYRGYKGKKGAEAQKKAEEAAKTPEGELPPQSQSDSSPMQGTGEPMETAPVAGGAAEEKNGMTAPDNGTVGNTGKQEATVAKNAQAGAAAGRPATVRNGGGEKVSRSLEELKREAENHRNPAVTGVMRTAQQEDELRRIAKAATKAEVTAIDYGVSEEKLQEALRLRELTGKEIVFEPSGKGYKGFYDPEADEIHLAAGTENVMAAIFGHELTHSIEGTAQWEELRALVAKRMGQTGKSWETARRQRQELYAQAGHAVDNDRRADREVVAHYIEKHLLTDEQAIRELVRDDRSIARRILDWLDSLWAKLPWAEKSRERDFLRKAREIYREAMAESARVHERREQVRTAKEAYARGDDAAGDAALEAAYADKPEGWLEADEYDDDDPRGDGRIPFSIGGVNARGADLAALERAQRMEEEGSDRARIFRETGWFRGADGKWRFEIDDSGMKYHRGGDARFRRDHGEYARYKELELRFIEGTITEAEMAEIQELSGTWFREAGRLSARIARGNATLANMIDHDALFDAYPQLRDVKVRFDDTGDGANGWWDKDRNEIVISKRLRRADAAYMEGILLHEIQHAIQDMEGFAGGASPEHWEEIQSSDRAIRVNDRKIAKAEREAQDALKGLPTEVARDFWYAANMMDNDPEGALKLDDELMAGEYAEAYGDYSWAIWTLQELAEQDNPKRSAKELYRNTAGEIEARDTANRRHLGAEARKSRLPDTGDERTVFAEGDARQYSIRESDTEYEKAVRSGDMQTAQRMVDEAAERWGAYRNNNEANATFRQEGEVRIFYHGTDAKNFTTFDSRFMGSTDGDLGWFGKGFYFTFSADEAEGYGDRVIPAYLRMRNPFDYSQLYRFEGSDASDSEYSQFAWMHNIASQFPDIIKDAKVWDKSRRMWVNRNNAKEGAFVTWEQTVEQMDQIRRELPPSAEGAEMIDRIGAHMENVLGISPVPRPVIEDLDFSGAVQRAGYDGIIQSVSGDEAVVFTPEQIKSAEPVTYNDSGEVVPLSKRFDGGGRDIRGFVQEEEGGFTRGWHDDDEAARAANMEGYPVINGVQVVPMKTFVLAQDYRKDKAGNVILDKQGNPIQNHNYGLVAGLGSKPGTLKINFHNKNVVNEETGQTLRKDGVEIDIADLTPTPGVFQQTDEDFQSLIEQAPEEETYYSEEERAEIEALRNRASMEEAGGGRPENWESVTREDITGRARESLQRGEQQLAGRIAGLMMVPRWARQDFLEPVVRGLIDTYLEQGTVDQGLRDELFDTAWKEGRVVEREFYDTYRDVKEYLRTTPMFVPQEIRDSIGDFDEYGRRIFGKIRAKKEKFAELKPGKGEAQQAILGFFPDGTRPNPGKNGGLDIDTVWSEAQQMAPELFPEDILNQEDRVRHMLDVAASIKKTEMNLNEFYAGDLENAMQWSRNNFEYAVQDAIRTAWEVRRVALDQQADAAAVAGEDGEVLTVEEVAALYPKLKDVRRELEKAMAKNLLNKQDKNQVQRLLRHDIQPEHLDPEVDNVRGILAVYEAKKAFEEIAKPVREWNRQRKARLYAEAEELVYEAEMAGGIKDKGKGFLYSRETMERNIRDIVKNPEHADKIIDTYFRPVHQAEAAATRMKNQYRERVKALDISRKVRKGDQVSEAYAVQFYGEVSDILRMMEQSKFRLKQRDGKSYKEWQAELQKLWEENPSLDKGKIENAAREMGKIYEELFDQMNKARVENGYEPINHRSGYFPHFQQDGRDGILSQFGKAMGIDVEVQALPTSINGMTHTFKPGIRWFGNALERKTFDTAYDAVEGFDRYIEGCASVVHQTANIQRLRALANQIRYRTGDEGLREQIRKIQAREDLTDEQKDTLIRETASEGKFQLSNFVVELDEYTNLLANKKSRADRNMEQAMGRDMYNIVKALESRVAANMAAINFGSWLTNFIPLTQGWAALDTRYWLKGMGQTIRAVKTDDGMVDMSDFLTNRVGSDALVQTTAQKVAGVLSSPMEWIDGFTAGSLVRARYAQNIAQGMSKAEAMSEADEWTAGVMADRSKGAMPTVFHRSNPLTKVFTQFQLEVNNQLGYMLKDIPREKRKKGVLAVAAALLKLALGAWLFNELYEKLLGRRPALDPIDMAFGFVKDWADPELDFADAAANLGGKIAENTPFIGGLVGGGRVPISSALPDVMNLVKAVGDSDWSAGKKLAAAGKELAKPLTYMVLPFGGGQVKKIWEGLKMIRKDGSYTVDKDGNPLLQYPLYSTNDAVQKALEAGQAMLFGKTTIRSGRAWVEGGFKNLSADQTATYQALVNLGVEQADAFELLTAMRAEEKDAGKRQAIRTSGLEGEALATVYYDLMATEDERAAMEKLVEMDADMGIVACALMDMKDAKKTETMEEGQVKRQILREYGLEGEPLATVYHDLLVDDDSKEKALMEALQKDGADMGTVASCLMDMKDAADSNAKRDILRTSGLTERQKQDIYRDRISKDYDERIEKFRDAGMDMDDFLIAQNEYTKIKDSYEDEGDMATAFARWVNNSGYTATQKAVIRDSLKYWRQLPANADGYDRAIEAGLSDEDAAELVEAIGELEPPEGKTSVQEIQKYRVAIDQSVSESNQLKMLQSVGLKDSSYDKVAKGYEMGVAPAAWVRVKEVQQQYDANGNGNMTNAEWEAAIEGICSYGIVLPGDNTRFNLTNEQKGVLWQMLVGKSIKAKNNPFSPEAGQRWRELMGYE